ncbi:MAG TPA: PrsW family glutamic-type intramembrane protease [Acidimicrobiales bacterium]|nr:PrsW family glutamic-type intramembrane protease [Acidimicrobiales bacterium]
MSFAIPQTFAQRALPAVRLHPQRWLRLLVAGALLWGLAVLTLELTNDWYVVPSVVILGSFAVPVALLLRLCERRRPFELTSPLLVRLFVGGGVIGFLCSALLEAPLTSQSPAIFDGSVGVIEEVAKLAVLACLTWRLPVRSRRAGFVAGAAVGFGFAAFESAGYAASALASSGMGQWGSLISLEALRALIAPATHGLWTAITGAILFRQARGARFRITGTLVAVVAAVAALHGLWDLAPDLSRGIGGLLTGSRFSNRMLSSVLPSNVGSGTQALTAILQCAVLVALAGVGFLFAHLVVRRRPGAALAGVSAGREPVEVSPWGFVGRSLAAAPAGPLVDAESVASAESVAPAVPGAPGGGFEPAGPGARVACDPLTRRVGPPPRPYTPPRRSASNPVNRRPAPARSSARPTACGASRRP